MASRRERVILDLEDNFTAGMIRAAGATALLDKNLDHLSGSSADANKSIGNTNREVEKSSPIFTQASKDIDRYSGRLRLLGEAAVLLGPALVPIGAVAVPAVVALASGLTAAAGAAGVALLAFNGVGDALKALDAYQLDPSTAHLEKMRQEFEKIGPTGVEFVRFLDSLEPQLKDLQEVSRQGLFPGVEDGITSLLTMMPQLRLIVFNLATELGKLAKQAGDSLAGDGFSAFFDYLETDAAPTLEAFAHTLGNVAQGLGSLIVAFAPVSRDFSAGMEAMSKSFADWAAGLSQTDGFRNFVAYVRESGPQVLALLGSLATAFIAIAQAAAPVGAAVLPALTALARVLTLIAQSPIGPPLFTAVAAMLALNRAATLLNAGLGRVAASGITARTSLAGIGKGIEFGLIIAGISGVDKALDAVFGDRSIDADKLNRNLAALANGDAVDGLDAIGKNLDIVNQKFLEAQNSAFGFLPGDTTWGEAKDNIDKVDEALAQLVETGQQDLAAKAFKEISQQAADAGVSAEETTKWFKQYNLALENAAPAADHAAEVARKLAKAHNEQAASADKAAASTKGLVSAMEDETQAALGAFDAETQYREALKAAAAQAKKNDAGIRGNTEAVLGNRSALSQLAAAWNNQSNAVKNNVDRFHQARTAFIDTATAMGVPARAAKALADRILEIPKSIVIKQQNNMDPAVQTAKLLANAIRNIPTAWQTNYRINTIRTGTDPELHAPRANGGEIFGQRHPYGDKVLAMLAPGEEVISNRYGQADRFRADRASGRIPRYADGGTAGGRPTSMAAWMASKNGDPFAGLGDAAHEAGINLALFNKISLKELKQRDNFLNWQQKQAELDEKQAEKALQVQRDRLDEERAQLKALKDARDQFEQSVAANFKTNLFGTPDLATAAKNGMLGDSFNTQLDAFAKAQHVDPATSRDDLIQQYLATLSSGQTAALQVQANQAQLQQDTTQAGAFDYVLSELRKMGLKGDAYAQLAQSGDLRQAQALLGMSPADIAELVQNVRNQNKTLGRLGGNVGDAQFGHQIAQQTRAVERQARLTHQMADHVREMNQNIREQTRLDRELTHRIGVLTKLEQKRKAEAKKQADDTGAAVAKHVNNTVTHGRRKA